MEARYRFHAAEGPSALSLASGAVCEWGEVIGTAPSALFSSFVVGEVSASYLSKNLLMKEDREWGRVIWLMQPSEVA